MKNFILVLMIALMGFATYAAPPHEKVVPTRELSMSEAVFDLILSTNVEMDMGNSFAISVDKLKGAERLYASAVNYTQSDADVSVPDVVVKEDTGEFNLVNFLIENWKAILLALIPLAEFITRLTPTKKDDTFLTKLFSFIPNLKEGGGTHATQK